MIRLEGHPFVVIGDDVFAPEWEILTLYFIVFLIITPCDSFFNGVKRFPSFWKGTLKEFAWRVWPLQT